MDKAVLSSTLHPRSSNSSKQKNAGWETKSNPKFEYGKELLPRAALDLSGLEVERLHEHYMLLYSRNVRDPIGFNVPKGNPVMPDGSYIPIELADLYDLVNIDALDHTILRVFCL